MSTAQPPSAASSSRGQRAFIGAAIVLFAAVSAYLALVIITRVDSIFFPGDQIVLTGLPGGTAIGNALPGVDAEGESGNQDRINILVLGLDRRARDGDSPSRTDTMFVVTVDPKTHTSGILGIPRDMIVEIPYKAGGGTFQDRVNTVYVHGELSEYPRGGIGLAKEVILENFGIEIDKHVIVDFEGFEEIIDALGGIDVDVPQAVYDPYYSETELPGDYFPQDFEVGRQHMDGRTALAYARIRFSSDDLDRIQRQQRVIFATVEKAKSINVLKNASSLWEKYNDAISTDIGDAQIIGYARLADQVKDDISAISLGPATAPCTGPGGAAWLCSSDEAVANIVEAFLSEGPASGEPQPTMTPDPVRVQVQNGTDTEGLAARVVNYIATRGYPVNDLNPANVFDGQRHSETEIIDLSGTQERNGFLLAKWLGVDVAQVRTATADELATMEGDAEIVIILGADFDLDALSQSPTTTTSGG